MQLNAPSGSFAWPSTRAAALLALAISLFDAQITVIAQTRTVGVEVTFVERIEVARAARTQSLRTGVADDDPEDAPPGSGGTSNAITDAAADQSFVTALSIQATPRRAVTLHVGTSEARDATSFLCTYGSVQQAECGGAGIAAISLADAELTIDRGAQGAGDAKPGAEERAGIEVTITYQ